ncbi:unnamed protein product [Cochlearia groenlandica]
MIKMDIQRLFLKKEAQQTFGQTSRRCQSQVTVTRSVLEERNSTFFRLKTSRRCQSQVTCYIRPNIYLDVKPKLKELLKKKTQQRRKEETQSGYEHLKNAKYPSKNKTESNSHEMAKASAKGQAITAAQACSNCTKEKAKDFMKKPKLKLKCNYKRASNHYELKAPSKPYSLLYLIES